MAATLLPPIASSSRLELSSAPSSSALGLTPVDHDPSGWQVVLRQPNEGKVVLFHPRLNELSVRDDLRLAGYPPVGGGGGQSGNSTGSGSSCEVGLELVSSGKRGGVGQAKRRSPEQSSVCPLCMQSLPTTGRSDGTSVPQREAAWPTSSYFQLLSTTDTPRSSCSSQAPTPVQDHPAEELNAATLCDGYYAQYFDEVQLLGRGGQGAVYLAAHVLNGERLGMYAVKKG